MGPSKLCYVLFLYFVLRLSIKDLNSDLKMEISNDGILWDLNSGSEQIALLTVVVI